MTWLRWAALLAGCGLAAGVVLLVHAVRPPAPALGPALARLRPGRGAYTNPARQRVTGLIDRLVPDRDLAVLDRTRRHYLLGVTISAGLGFAMAPVLAAAFTLIGLRLPFALPAVGGLGLAAAAALVVYRDVHAQAVRARAQFRLGVCVYLDQVALLAAAGHGPVEALERAAAIGDGPVFTRIRDALNHSRLELIAPWDQLRHLGGHLGVPALGDLGDIMATSGVAGAHVYRTLRAKTSSLRSQIRFDELAAAKSTSTMLDGLGAALVLVLLLIAIYPFLARLF